MNVLHVIHYPVFGGPHNQALQLHQALVQRGWQTTVLLPDEPGNAAERLRTTGVAVEQMRLHRLRARPDPRLQARFALGFVSEVHGIRRLIRRRGVDLVLVGGLVNPHAAVAARLERIPVVWQLLDTRPPMALRRVVMPLVTRLSDAMMTTGMGVADVHPGARAFGDRLVSFFPPVDPNRFAPNPERRLAARAELGLATTDVVIGTVGNINPMKGHGTFVRAAAALRQSCPGARFVVLGATYPHHEAYAQAHWNEAASLGMRFGHDLTVRDPGTRVADLASAFDVFWLTSEPRSEGIPTVVEEAMALAVPVVTVDVGAVRDAVEDGVSGFVVAPGDPSAIADATVRMLTHPDMLARMGDISRRRAVEQFDVERCADSHLRAFDIALAHHRQVHQRTMR